MGSRDRFIIVLVIATILTWTGASIAVAGKTGHPGTSRGSGGTISLVLLESTDGLAHYGQHVTFDVSTTATDRPWVELDCYQSGALVYQDWRGFFEGSLTGQNFTLGTSAAWQSGAADCTGWLEKYTKRGWKPLSSTSFHVYE